jgi:tRNA-dihydrouridine synthase A
MGVAWLTSARPIGRVPAVTTERRGVLRPLSIAPMMDYTDRHFRVVMRALTRQTLLYSEMIHCNALVLGRRHDLLAYDPIERPLALQLGGDSAPLLAEAAKIAEDLGWDEVNLNVGCPSDRVQKGRFGACLMAHPEVVAEAVEAMRAAVKIPVTVKHRIGIDDLDRYEDMLAFVDRVAEAGSDRFTVHARKAWLSGLSPRENRTIPPIRYPEVYRLKAERPHLAIEINGQVRTLAEAADHLREVDAVMIGRAAYETPAVFMRADSTLFGMSDPSRLRVDAAAAVLPYLARETAAGVKAHAIARHLLGLFAATPLARAWKHGIAQVGQAGAAAPQAFERLIEEAAVRGVD